MNHVVITGFMATGKTTVGRLVAHRLNRPFIDMDRVIENRSNKSIARIFQEDGEASFRALESELCEELCQQENLVIATGGGALTNANNRAMFGESDTVICLTSSPEEITRRLEVNNFYNRPLLNVEDKKKEIERLLEKRQPAYATIPYHIDTTKLPISEVVDRVLSLVNVRHLPVQFPSGQYHVQIGHGLLSQIGGLIQEADCPEGSRVAIVTNPVVEPLYARRIHQALESKGYRSFICLVQDGEKHKTMATLSSLFEQFLDFHLDRRDTVLALGGGVTGDLAGFAAAIYLRGIRLIQVPTTLLSMIDASVGGKTAIDLPRGKNLVGAFKQPQIVIIDPTVLSTLALPELRSGMAEVIKHCMIDDSKLFVELEEHPGEFAILWQEGLGIDWLQRALQVKIKIVEEDPFEQGKRAFLNLGHTIGHALEQVSQYKLRHGEAVSIGLVAETRIAHKLQLVPASLVSRVENLLAAWNLPIRSPAYSTKRMLQAMKYDKKRQGRVIRWALPHAQDHIVLREDVPIELVKSVLTWMGAIG